MGVTFAVAAHLAKAVKRKTGLWFRYNDPTKVLVKRIEMELDHG